MFPFGWSGQASTVAPDVVHTPQRPKVALALSAGAARGWSQIGVLRTLLDSGFQPDIVVGTSIGAVVGGCFCAGRLDQVEAFARSLSRRRVFGLMDVSFSGMGLLGGSRLRSRLDHELGTLRVEELQIRFAAVATEVHTGHEVWLSAGPLVEALRASYALPGLFEPISVDGRWLMDGALVNPIPVSVCRALGANIVVAVNLVADTLGRHVSRSKTVESPPATPSPSFLQALWAGSEPSARLPAAPRIAGVLVDAFNITQDRIARSRLAGDPPDVTINVKCGTVGLFDFHRAKELIDLGRDAAQKALPDLQEYVDVYPSVVGGPSPEM